jgi:hypothetical protein
MELFLNFVWAMIALAALGTWRACWMHEHRIRRRDPVREWAAVVCGLVLLFFAVSLSDDLHSSFALLDESAAGRRHSLTRNAAHVSPDALTSAPVHALAWPMHSVWPSLLSSFAAVQVVPTQPVSFIQSARPFGRAPPYFLA